MSTSFAPSRLARPLLLAATFLVLSALGVAPPVAESHHRCWHKSQCPEPVTETTEPVTETTEPVTETTEPVTETTEPVTETTEPVTDTTALWSSGFEGGLLDDWLAVHQMPSDHQVRADDYAPREGLRSARFELQPGDVLSNDGTARQQIYGAKLADGSHRRFYEGDDLYFGFSVRLRDDYPVASDKWQLLTEWKNPSPGPGPFKLVTRTDASGDSFRLEGLNNIVYWRGPVVKSTWLDFVVRVKFSPDPKVGFMEVWHTRPQDAALVAQTMTNGSQRQYFSTLTPGDSYSYLKAGLYRDTSFSTPSVAWFDAWRIATNLRAATAAATSAAAPGASLAPEATPTTEMSRSQTGSHPAKLQVHRVAVRDGRLDMLADVTRRADGEKVEVDVHAAGRHYTFDEPIERGRLRVDRALPRVQGRKGTAIVTLRYRGNDRVRPSTVRLRAARRHADLKRTHLSLREGVLRARGGASGRASGVARIRLSYDRPGGTVGEWQGRARIRDGEWRLREELPPEARHGGYLTIQYTGYLPGRVRGEQIAKQVLAGQVFESKLG